MELFLLSVFLIALFLVALVRPYWGVLAVLFLLPSYEWRFEVFGLPTTFLEWAILLVTFAWVLRTYWHRDAGVGGLRTRLRAVFERLRSSYLLWPAILFVVASVIAVVVAPDVWKALGLWRAFILEPLLLMIVLLDVVEEEDHWFGVVWSLGLSAIAVSLGAVLQVVGGIGLIAGYDGLAESMLRATSFFTYPAAVGLYLTPIILLFLGLLISKKDLIRAPYRPSAWLVVVLSLVGIVMAQTDGAVVGLTVGVFFLAVVRWTWWKPVVAVAVIALLVFTIPGLRTRAVDAVTFQDTSGQVRLALWEGSLYLLADRPVVGTGLGGFTQLYGDYKLAQHTEETLNHPHSLFLNFWAELTVLGAIAVMWLFVAFTRLVEQTKNGPKDRDQRLYALSAVLLGVIVYGMVDVPFFKNDLAVLWWIPFVLAVLVVDSQTTSSLPERRSAQL